MDPNGTMNATVLDRLKRIEDVLGWCETSQASTHADVASLQEELERLSEVVDRASVASEQGISALKALAEQGGDFLVRVHHRVKVIESAALTPDEVQQIRDRHRWMSVRLDLFYTTTLGMFVAVFIVLALRWGA